MGYSRRLAALMILAPVAAVAHSGATGIVKERMETMKELSYAAKALGALRAGAIPFSMETARYAGEQVALHGAKAAGQFPEGSLQAPTEALPVIWEQPERFAALMAEMEAAGRALAQAADEDAVWPAAERAAETCKACHQIYRKP